MNKKQKKRLNKCIKKIIWYAVYVDCFNRILNEFIENGDDNLKPCDMPNLSELLSCYSRRLYMLSLKAGNILEFK